jgi:hypothetical protein
MASQIVLVGAGTMAFFTFYTYSLQFTTLAFLFLVIAGSFFAWRSMHSSQIVLLLSLIFSQYMVMQQVQFDLTIPFIFLDLVLVLLFSRMEEPE